MSPTPTVEASANALGCSVGVPAKYDLCERVRYGSSAGGDEGYDRYWLDNELVGWSEPQVSTGLADLSELCFLWESPEVEDQYWARGDCPLVNQLVSFRLEGGIQETWTLGRPTFSIVSAELPGATFTCQLCYTGLALGPSVIAHQTVTVMDGKVVQLANGEPDLVVSGDARAIAGWLSGHLDFRDCAGRLDATGDLLYLAAVAGAFRVAGGLAVTPESVAAVNLTCSLVEDHRNLLDQLSPARSL